MKLTIRQAITMNARAKPNYAGIRVPLAKRRTLLFVADIELCGHFLERALRLVYADKRS
jgi:hypothetical protein